LYLPVQREEVAVIIMAKDAFDKSSGTAAAPPAGNGKPRTGWRYLAATGGSLVDFYEQRVRPRLTAEALFSHPAHRWQKAGDKWRGGCPWHESESGTAFYVDVPSLQWRCPACSGARGEPVQYVWKLQRGPGAPNPRGEDFRDVVRQMAGPAGVPFIEQPVSAEDLEQTRLRDARRAILESAVTVCQELLWSEQGRAARAYLQQRGFGEEDCHNLELGLYPTCPELKQRLLDLGHDREDVEASAAVFGKMVGYVVFPWRDDRSAMLTLYGKWPEKEPPKGKVKTIALANPGGKGPEAWEHTKRSPLYLDRALRAGQLDLVLVEGATDAALPQVRGDARVIACVGAELSALHVQTLARHRVRSLPIALDPDKAGDTGILSCVRPLHEPGIGAYVAPRLPEKTDPDDFILDEGIDAWRGHVSRRVHAFRHAARAIIDRHGQREQGDGFWADAVIEEAAAFARSVPESRREELARHFVAEIANGIEGNADDLRSRILGAQPHQNGAQTEGEGLSTTCLADIRPEPVRWLVPNYVLLGKLVLLAGDGGHGKSTLTIDEAACPTTGRPCFGLEYTPPEPCEVLLVGGEDGYEGTVVPRAHTAGADLARIRRVDGLPGADGKVAPFGLHHFEAIRAELTRRPLVRLVVIDPAGAYIGRAGVDEHKDADLRALLDPLAEVASRSCVTIQLVKHLVKGATAKAVYKVSGSAAYCNAVRAVFLLAPSPQDEELKLLMPVKFNLGPKPKVLGFRRAALTAGQQQEVLARMPLDQLDEGDRQRLAEQMTRLTWQGVVEVDPEAVMSDASRKDRGPSKVDQAKEWLTKVLE
jgi:RecA-family ATPase